MSEAVHPSAPSVPSTRSPRVQFGLHYLEMIAVMLAGMLVLGSALGLAAEAVGYGSAELEDDAPALILAGMGFSMAAPMIAWMRWRGHSWAANRAMAISMIAPTVAVILLLAAGALEDLGTLMAIQHVVMFPGMFVAMLLYRSEYVHGVEAT